MGKGDKKSTKGKRAMGSYGKTRKRKEDAPIIVVKKEKKEKPVKAEPKAKPAAATKKPAAKKAAKKPAAKKKVVKNILINRITAPGSDHLVNPTSKGLIRSNNI